MEELLSEHGEGIVSIVIGLLSITIAGIVVSVCMNILEEMLERMI